jgi:tetraacyldisaccharide 4'-kinase
MRATSRCCWRARCRALWSRCRKIDIWRTVHILDDGFQHVTLARDLDILVTSPGEIAHGRVLPFGRLRESIGAAARAHLVVVVGADEAAARSEGWTLGVSQFCAARRVLRPGIDGDTGDVKPVFAIAGIGNPTQFFEGLREAGLDVRGTRAFPDHHHYGGADVEEISRLAQASGAAAVVTTEKDAVRLEGAGRAPFPIIAVPMSLEFAAPETLAASIDAALARARGAA